MKTMLAMLLVLLLVGMSLCPNAVAQDHSNEGVEVELTGRFELISEAKMWWVYFRNSANDEQYFVAALYEFDESMQPYVDSGETITIRAMEILGLEGTKSLSKIEVIGSKETGEVHTNAENASAEYGFLDFINDHWDVILLVLLGFIVTGVVLAKKGEIVVYNDYNDLLVNFVAFMVPPIFLLLILLSGKDLFFYAGVALELGLIGYIIKTTYTGNDKDLLKTFLALMTKLPLGLIYCLALLDLIDGSGKDEDGKNKGMLSKLLLLVLTPLMFVLVKNKSGAFDLFSVAKSGIGRK